MTEFTTSDTELDGITRIDGVPIAQMLSFLGHDIYGPISMLRTYLQAVADTSEDEEMRTRIGDAESLAGQVEGMVRLLRTQLSLAAGQQDVRLQPFRIEPLLLALARVGSNLSRLDRLVFDEDLQVYADERLLSQALEGTSWQLGRMGSRQGPVSLGVVACGEGRIEVGVWRTDEDLDAEGLSRALHAREEDWTPFLRRLPACGFPLRVAKRVVEAMGGELLVRREIHGVAFVLPLRASQT